MNNYFFNKKLPFLIFCLLLSATVSFSQKTKKSKEKPEKRKSTRTNAIYLQVPVPYLKLEFKDHITANHLEFEPTPLYNLGIGMKLGGFNLAFGTGVAVYKQNLAVKGKSKYKDIQIQINTKSFSHDFCYQNFKGFFVRNTGSFMNASASNPYLLRPDLRFTLIGMNTLYILNNEKFSFKNAFGFNALDRKYGGSFLIGAYFYSMDQEGDSGLVSRPFKNYFDSTSCFLKSTEQTYGVSIGYGFMAVILKRLHLTVAVAEGFGLYDIKYTLENRTTFESPSEFATKTSLRFTIGYDLGKVFIGGNTNFDIYKLKNKSFSNIDFSNGKFRVFIGYRLGRQKKHE